MKLSVLLCLAVVLAVAVALPAPLTAVGLAPVGEYSACSPGFFAFQMYVPDRIGLKWSILSLNPASFGIFYLIFWYANIFNKSVLSVRLDKILVYLFLPCVHSLFSSSLRSALRRLHGLLLHPLPRPDPEAAGPRPRLRHGLRRGSGRSWRRRTHRSRARYCG